MADLSRAATHDAIRELDAIERRVPGWPTAARVKDESQSTTPTDIAEAQIEAHGKALQ